MNRIFPPLLIMTVVSVVAAMPGDPPPSPNATGKPSAKPSQAADGAEQTPPVLWPRKRPVIDPALYAKALPEERQAVRAALDGRGWAEYDNLGRVTTIRCEEATEADVKLFAALKDLEDLTIGSVVGKPAEGYFGQPKVGDSGLAPLLKAPALRALALIDTQVTNEGLKVVGQMTRIESLYLSSKQISGPGMAYLAGVKKLQHLCLIGSSVGDDGMREVAKHTSLRDLELGARVTPRGLAELVGLPSLERLDLYRAGTDDDMVPIGQMTNLVSMRCGMGRLTDEGLRHMQNMTRLRSLNLTPSEKVTDAGMVFVGRMKGLETLKLNKRIGDDGVAALSELTNLKELYLRGTQITDGGLAKLTALRQLRRLNLVLTHVSAAGVAQLRGITNLQFIDIDYTAISDRDAAKLKDSGIPVDKQPGTNPSWMKK